MPDQKPDPSKEKKEKEEIKLSAEEKEEILEELFSKGYVTSELIAYKTKNKELKIKVKNLSAASQLNAERGIPTNRNASYTIHEYVLSLLSHTVIEFNGNAVENPDDARDRLGNLPAPIIDKLAKQLREFERKVSTALEVESISETFSQGAEPLKD